jgi:hypothetical protein
MANLPPNSLPDFDAVAQSKTLFLPAPGTLGVVVAMSVRLSRKERRFANVGAALAWCEKHRINLVYFFPPRHDQSRH